MNLDQGVGQTEKHFAIVTRVTDEKLKEGLRGAVYFRSDTLTGKTEYPEPAEPSFPLAGANGEGFFWVPQVGDQIEVEIGVTDEAPAPRYTRMLYSSEDEIPAVFKTNYPYRMGWRTRAGHLLLFDNSAEKELVMFFHKKGTGFEWDKDGNEIKTVVKDLIETIKGEVTREVVGKVSEMFEAEVERIYSQSVSEIYKKDLTEDVQGARTMKSKKDTKLDSGGALDVTAKNKATFSGKAGTDVGSSSGMTNVQGQMVNLAGGGLPVAKVGSQVVGPGNLGAPVIGMILDGSTKVTTA